VGVGVVWGCGDMGGCGGVKCVCVWGWVVLCVWEWDGSGVYGVCVGACSGFGVWVVWGGWGCLGHRGWWCGGCGGVGVVGGFPLRSNIPRSALCATLDTYNFKFLVKDRGGG
jgi:hypothetical protein